MVDAVQFALELVLYGLGMWVAGGASGYLLAKHHFNARNVRTKHDTRNRCVKSPGGNRLET